MVKKGEFFQKFSYASESQCKIWKDIILSNRDKWKKRFEVHTFGNAYYLEVEAGALRGYHMSAKVANKLVEMLPNFKKLMIDSSKFLEGPNNETNLPTRARCENLGDYWCDTGVQMISVDENRIYKGGSIHPDYVGIAPYPRLYFDKNALAFSAILSITAHEQGGGLNVWPYRILPTEESDHKSKNFVSCDYEIGTLTIIDSYLYHQIQSVFSINEDYRMTGTIHFLYLDEPYPHWEHWF